MKKIIRLGALITTLILSMLMIVSCGNKNQLLGKWSLKEIEGVKIETTMEFIDDENGKSSLGGAISVDFKYTYEGDELTVSSEISGNKSEQKYTVESVDSDKLVLKPTNKDVKLEYEKVD